MAGRSKTGGARAAAGAFVIPVGTAICECLLEVAQPVELGCKHLAVGRDALGGSGLNYALRLLAAGGDVFPILTVGDDDRGRRVQEALLKAATAGRASAPVMAFLRSRDFLAPNIRTLRSVILLDGAARTIFSYDCEGHHAFLAHVERQWDRLAPAIRGRRGALILGHIYGDRPHRPTIPAGACTRFLVDRFGGAGPVLINFGNSQLALGIDFWMPLLRSCDIIQANTQEIGGFFAASGRTDEPLRMLHFLRDQPFSTVLTLGGQGALLIDRTDRRRILHLPAWSVKTVDPTGAGDACAAGLAVGLRGRKSYTSCQIQRALAQGALWSAYACTSVGGAGSCPNARTLSRFRSRLAASQANTFRALSVEAAAALLGADAHALRHPAVQD